jgi:hypothetical protein
MTRCAGDARPADYKLIGISRSVKPCLGEMLGGGIALVFHRPYLPLVCALGNFLAYFRSPAGVSSAALASLRFFFSAANSGSIA